MVTRDLKGLLTKILQWIKSPVLHNSVNNTNTFYVAQRDDTNVSVGFGVGAGGTNHGVYSSKLGKWLVYGDASNVYVDGRVMAPLAYTPTLPTTVGIVDFRVRKYGAVVTITISNVTKAATGNNVLFTLPEGWRPPTSTALMVIAPAASITAGQTNLSLRLTVGANGEVALYNYRSSAISSNTNASGVLTYIATQ